MNIMSRYERVKKCRIVRVVVYHGRNICTISFIDVKQNITVLYKNNKYKSIIKYIRRNECIGNKIRVVYPTLLLPWKSFLISTKFRREGLKNNRWTYCGRWREEGEGKGNLFQEKCSKNRIIREKDRGIRYFIYLLYFIGSTLLCR